MSSIVTGNTQPGGFVTPVNPDFDVTGLTPEQPALGAVAVTVNTAERIRTGFNPKRLLGQNWSINGARISGIWDGPSGLFTGGQPVYDDWVNDFQDVSIRTGGNNRNGHPFVPMNVPFNVRPQQDNFFSVGNNLYVPPFTWPEWRQLHLDCNNTHVCHTANCSSITSTDQNVEASITDLVADEVAWAKWVMSTFPEYNRQSVHVQGFNEEMRSHTGHTNFPFDSAKSIARREAVIAGIKSVIPYATFGVFSQEATRDGLTKEQHQTLLLNGSADATRLDLFQYNDGYRLPGYSSVPNEGNTNPQLKFYTDAYYWNRYRECLTNADSIRTPGTVRINICEKALRISSSGPTTPPDNRFKETASVEAALNFMKGFAQALQFERVVEMNWHSPGGNTWTNRNWENILHPGDRPNTFLAANAKLPIYHAQVFCNEAGSTVYHTANTTTNTAGAYSLRDTYCTATLNDAGQLILFIVNYGATSQLMPMTLNGWEGRTVNIERKYICPLAANDLLTHDVDFQVVDAWEDMGAQGQLIPGSGLLQRSVRERSATVVRITQV